MAEDVFGWFFPGLVKAIHVELSDEAVDVAMPEILGQYELLELFYVFDGEFLSVVHPGYNFGVLIALNKKMLTFMI